MKTAYYGNPWIGMFIRTNDEVTMLPIDSMKKLDEVVEAALKTKIVKIGMGDSNLLGVYLAMNSHGVVLPNIVKSEEVESLKKIGLNVHISSSKFNAYGNNIAVNDKGGIINPNVEREDRKKIEETLGVELVPMTIAEFTTVGSACIATNTGYLAHFKASEDELVKLNDALKVSGNKGTMNTGTGFVSYGAVVNKNGYVVGENTTAYEIGRMEDALNLVRE
ncbi:Translation initiation factor 6 [Candidatus Bilamarchaeum dharawalense]|uniref:Translation initiation factor 6 n=1 Tax=Candidatus Bilamarchaeum dharawalense TaxID=2885759 RepID=A0A5E4LP82_9ARCH|nr:Translation initiation factor 6 [Candidatus Bilamarchaeum dharawalense]